MPAGKLPSDYRVDGTSLKPFLSGETDRHRDWIYSTIGTSQLVRTKRYLLEAVNPILDMPRGRFYDCGDSRDGYGYINVTNSEDQQVQKARTEFDQILKKYPPLTKIIHFSRLNVAGRFWEDLPVLNTPGSTSITIRFSALRRITLGAFLPNLIFNDVFSSQN
jgi:hypothetical protein